MSIFKTSQSVDEIPLSQSHSWKSTQTIVFDKCAIFRQGLTDALNRSHFVTVSFSCDIENISRFETIRHNQLLIIIGPSTDASEAMFLLRSVRLCFPNSKIVLLCKDFTPERTGLMLRSGASAVLENPTNLQVFIEALELVMLGQSIVPLSLTSLAVQHNSPSAENVVEIDSPSVVRGHSICSMSRLSSREVEIVRCLMTGEANRSIAQRLIISEATVKVHVKAILRKIKVKNRTQAAVWALNNIKTRQGDKSTPTLEHVTHLIARPSALVLEQVV